MGRPRKNANTAGVTIPNDAKKVFDDFWPLIRNAKVELEQAQADAKALTGVYRGHLKAYKKAGGAIDELIIAWDLSKMEPADASRHIRKVNEHLLWLKVPLDGNQATMFGVFQDGKSVAAHVEDNQMEASLTDEVRRHQANGAGYAAGRSATVIDNPYDASTDLHGAWQQGYVRAQDELSKGLTTTSADAEGAAVN